MTTTTPLPKRYGYKLPLEALGGACIRVSIEFPDKLEYRAAYNGAINMLGKWFQWDHTQADYQDIPELNVEVAQVWSEVLAAATWEECVEFCARMIECLLTDADVQAALATLISDNPAIQDALRDFVMTDSAINEHITNIAAAEVLSLENRLENLLKPEACDPGFVFNQTSVLVQLLHDLTEDVFEALEVGTNQLERGNILVSAVPGIGGLLPFDEILALGDQIVEEVTEDYIGAYDEALYDDIRCGLFCLIKDDCELSIDRAIDFYIERLGEAVPDDPVEAFRAVLQFLIAGDFATDTPVYLMHLFCLTAIRLSQNILGIDFGKLGLRVTAAGDESDNDWETLCEDCPPPPPENCQDFTAGEGLWHIYADTGDYVSGQGYQGDYFAGFNQTVLFVERSATTGLGTATGYVFTLNAPVDVDTAFLFVNDVSSGSLFDLTGVSEITFDASTVGSWTDKDANYKIRLQLTTAGNSTWRLIEACVVIAP